MRRTMAAAALAALTWPSPTVSASMTDLERRHLVAHLEMTASWLVDEVSGLSGAQYEFRRAPEAWTIAEIVEHLVVVAPIYWQDCNERSRNRRENGAAR